MRRFSSLVFVIVLAAPAAVLAGQQPPPPQQRPRAQQPGGDLSPGEVQRLFDAYALVQAQEALGLDNEQYGRFVSAMKGLQETRRRNQQERIRVMGELQRLTNPRVSARADEAAIKARAGSALTNALGRPACAVLPLTTASGQTSVSLGCKGNRTFTGLPDESMYVAIPGDKWELVVEKLAETQQANSAMGKYYEARKQQFATA